jgi:GDP-L-fucose synthase
MRLLVTGSNGLVGSAIREINPDNAIYISRDDADLTDFSTTEKLFMLHKPTHVIHLAAEVGGIGGNISNSGDYFRNNILINTNVLEISRRVGVEKLISFMSTCVFPDDATYPLTVDQVHNGPPHPSNFSYAYAKRMLDVQSKAYRKQWGLDYQVLVPTNIYGPNDYWNLQEGHVVPSLIHKIYLAKKSNESLVVWGTGAPLREFVYAGDIGKLALWAVENYQHTEPLILSSGIEVSIHELVKTIARLMDFTGEIIFDANKPDGQYRKPSDSETLREYLPNFTYLSLEEGLKRTITWFERNFPHIRL